MFVRLIMVRYFSSQVIYSIGLLEFGRQCARFAQGCWNNLRFLTRLFLQTMLGEQVKRPLPRHVGGVRENIFSPGCVLLQARFRDVLSLLPYSEVEAETLGWSEFLITLRYWF